MASKPKQQQAQIDLDNGEQGVEKAVSVTKINSNKQEDGVAVAAPAGVVSRSKRSREPTETTAATTAATNGVQDSDTLEPEGKRTRLGRAAKAVAKPTDVSDDIHPTSTDVNMDGVDAKERLPSPPSQEQQVEPDNSNIAAMEHDSKDTAEATTASNPPATTDINILNQQQQQNELPPTTTTEAAAPGESTDSNNKTRWKGTVIASFRAG
jgi:hypothetical protein